MNFYAILIHSGFKTYLRFDSSKVRELVCFDYLKGGHRVGYLDVEEVPESDKWAHHDIGDGLPYYMLRA